MRPIWSLAALCALAAASCLAAPIPGKDDYKIRGGKFHRGDTATTLQAVQVKDLMTHGGDISGYVPALVRIGESGGNAVAFDLIGFNADGTALDPAMVERLRAMTDRIDETRMASIVRVLGDSTDPKFRKNAARTAAKALRRTTQALYCFDGPDAAALARLFKKTSKNLLTAAPENGDLRVVPGAPQGAPDALTLYLDALPTEGRYTLHFLLRGSDGDYARMDEALKMDVERKPWTPDNSVLAEAERAEGYIALFDGKSLDGWWIFGDNPDGFRVNDAGEIEWAAIGASALMTRDRYDNFILRLEYKIEDGGNSGIFLRAPRNARQSRIGMEFQIHGDQLPDINDDTTGAVYKVAPPLVNASAAPGEWNDLEIVLDGAKLKATLNGQLVQDLDLDANEELRMRLRRGFIGLQDHANRVWFRNIRVKPL